MVVVCCKFVLFVDKGYFFLEEILLEFLEYVFCGNVNDVVLLNLKKFGINLILMLFG